MIESNYLIINRIPETYDRMKIAGKAAVFLNGSGKMIDRGAVRIDDTVYAFMYCDEVRNITLVTESGDVITILCRDAGTYDETLSELRKASGRSFSKQNKRINRYAESVAEKLGEGVRLRVTDAVDQSEMVECPECGMLNPKGSVYCLDCGAEI